MQGRAKRKSEARWASRMGERAIVLPCKGRTFWTLIKLREKDEDPEHRNHGTPESRNTGIPTEEIRRGNDKKSKKYQRYLCMSIFFCNFAADLYALV